jgi:thiol-disulfide isomerase/thioredoxin
MRAPVSTIPAPLFPRQGATWVNVATLRMEQQRGRPVLVEFWDFCRVNCLRTLPYLQAWDAKYPDLRVIGIHSPGFPPSADPDAVRAACERLGVEHAVLVDSDHTVWRAYENRGWPARYLWTPELRLFEYHFGEGGYDETERAIQELLGVEEELVAPLRPEDDPEALLVVPTQDLLDPAMPWSGSYEAGAVHAVLGGTGTITVDGEDRAVSWPGVHTLVEHPVSTRGDLRLDTGPGVTCHALAFSPGLAPAD